MGLFVMFCVLFKLPTMSMYFSTTGIIKMQLNKLERGTGGGQCCLLPLTHWLRGVAGSRWNSAKTMALRSRDVENPLTVSVREPRAQGTLKYV